MTLRSLTLVLLAFFILNSSYAQVTYQRVTFKPDPYIEYHKNGKVYKQGYINSKRQFVDTLKVYNPSGKLAMTAVYDKGVPQGQCVHYREDGSISMKGLYVKGKKDGLWTYPNRATSKAGLPYHFSVNYKNGLPHGDITLYEGKHKSRVVKAFFGKSKAHTKWEMYYDNSDQIWVTGFISEDNQFKTIRGAFLKDGKFIDVSGFHKNKEKVEGYLKVMREFFSYIPK